MKMNKWGLFVLIFAWQLLPAQPSLFTWTEFSLGVPAMRMSLPGVPQAQKANLPNEILRMIKRYDAYYIDNEAAGITITLTHVAYTDEVVANQKGAMDGTNAQWRATGAGVEVHTTVDRVINGKSALEQQGSYRVGAKEYEYYDLVATEGSNMWQVIVIIRTGDVVLRQTLNSIKDSIRF